MPEAETVVGDMVEYDEESIKGKVSKFSLVKTD